MTSGPLPTPVIPKIEIVRFVAFHRACIEIKTHFWIKHNYEMVVSFRPKGTSQFVYRKTSIKKSELKDEKEVQRVLKLCIREIRNYIDTSQD